MQVQVFLTVLTVSRLSEVTLLVLSSIDTLLTNEGQL